MYVVQEDGRSVRNEIRATERDRSFVKVGEESRGKRKAAASMQTREDRTPKRGRLQHEMRDVEPRCCSASIKQTLVLLPSWQAGVWEPC